MSTHDVGRHYETLVASALEARGWVVVDRNVRFGRREIDLIIRRDRLVVFVEVKARRGPGCGDPLEAITRRKQRDIEAVARWWIDRRGRPDDDYRFDAVAVRHERGVTRFEHVEDAWWPTDGGTRMR